MSALKAVIVATIVIIYDNESVCVYGRQYWQTIHVLDVHIFKRILFILTEKFSDISIYYKTPVT